MKILKGKNAGDGYKPHQWANDWMTADGHGRQNIVVRPTNVQLEGDEWWRLHESYSRFMSGDRSCGQFWLMWELHTDGTFTPRPPPEQAAELAARREIEGR